ncbi:ubiquitin-like-specific protease 1D isoform X1 [Zingiber officinale]|uniref:ubiquitin-like-specific protease 1D isoform X1 n=2 Tax=Zingiber officinale TaxID=94328 RepID=UPI001C4D501F|nr:ubiquitin-like-specific protease 1D isoform X1 [Zingiber officinale]
MAKQPIKIDWETVLPEMRDNGPPLEVEVVAMVASEGSDVANLADHALLESIQRLKKHLSSEIRSRLSDGGAKLKALLYQMDAERNRRDRVRDPEDTGSCDTTTQSKNMEYPVKNHSENPIQSKFASKFIEKLEGKADAAFDEDLNVINQCKANGYGENGLHKNERGHRFIITSQKTKHSSKQTPFKCVGRFKLRSFSDEHEDPCSSHRPKENYYNYKRRRMSAPDTKIRNSVSTSLEKVNKVVLLDEEEIHSVQTSEDGSDKWKMAIVYYPSREDPESVQLSYTDIACLEPKSYLTSSIMNFYIRYLQMSLSLVDRPKERYHFFNTYFYKKLEEAISPKANKEFEKLRRWWKGVNIFQKSYIFIPVHRDMHWSLVIICIPAKEDESGPIVLHLDSLGIHSSHLIFEVIDRYLKEEWSYMNQNSPPQDLPFTDKIWKNFSCRIDYKTITVPQQKNEYDCGLFVLYFMKKIIEDTPERFRRKYLSMFGSKWFKSEEASGLRKQIQGLVLEVFGSAMTENDKAESPCCHESPEDDCLQ